MMYRVIQWATGNVGRAAIEGVLDHPDLELVGCWVHSTEKDGVDVGTLLGQAAVGVAATTDVDALLAAEADCVLYSPLFADPAVVTRILESGKNVVTPLGWFYPPAAERERFDEVARRAGITLHGTGIHPGGITERFPLVLSALVGSVTSVRAEEFSDIRTYGAADVIRDWMLFGTTPEHARTSIMADALGGGFRQSVWMVADELGFAIDEHLRTTHEVAVATERFEVEVTGDPGVFVPFKRLPPASIEAGLARNPGIVATAMHCVNAIPYVCAAPPGLLTYLDLPPVAGRAAPSLGR